ncbi:MAG: spore germination protein [Oscillospiraceae bacterium]|nr:spore germination protein [Oscillospiraceae bacterium]
MEQPTPRKEPMYPGALTDGNIRIIFANAGDFFAREICCHGYTIYAYAIDGLISGGDMSQYVLKPICEVLSAASMRELYEKALGGTVYNAVAKAANTLDDVATLLVNGFCVVLFPGAGAVAYEVKTPEKRGISAPEVENTVKGPKDAFVETVRSNTSLIRRHLRSPDLRLFETKVGRRSLTNVTVVWLDGITDPALVDRMKRRLDEIDIDGMLSPSSVEEYVTGSRSTAFPLMQFTERADRFSQGILDGRVGLLVDGLPLGYLAPADLMYLMESPEDRGRDYVGASAVRVLRYVALLASLLLPGLYIALAAFHPAAIPLPLLRSIIESKKSVPFSTTAEVLGLLVAFELLQESGIHLPQAIGQSVSVVGGIVVGTAAVEAGLISPVALIMVSIAGVCGFVLPNRDVANAVRVWRFFIAILSAVAGIYGTVGGLAILLIHLLGLRSLGICYLSHTGSFLRRRLKKDIMREEKLNPRDRRKQK